MASVALKFYSKGTDTQKRSDVSMTLKRVNQKQLQKWTASERILAKAFIKDCEVRFEAWKKVINDL